MVTLGQPYTNREVLRQLRAGQKRRGLNAAGRSVHSHAALLLLLLVAPLFAAGSQPDPELETSTSSQGGDELAPKFVVALPAAASLHGVGPAFFHSDVVVFNASARRIADVTATYRCTSGFCGSFQRIFTIPPRQVLLLEDIAARLFDAPETGGAIEFASTERIVVASRLYTPDRPAPTLGMSVPAFGPEHAFVESELANLSHSNDPSVGFRTNLGVFNPGEQSGSVFIACRDSRGAALGFTTQEIGPHQLLQINDRDLFIEFSVLRSVPAFYCSVRANPPLGPLYTWAAVIDNQSTDPTFVTGQRFFANPRVLTVPAAASVHGAAATFFRSDVAVFNDDVLATAQVTARYRCFVGSCQPDTRTFTVGPGVMQVFGDVVGTLFAAPESAGTIDLVTGGHISVASRLYTADAVRGTVGTAVPTLDSASATPSQVLVFLSKGSRVNVGVLNAEEVPQLVTIRLFSGDGLLLGSRTRFLLARQGAQVNDIFGELGINEDVAVSYCTVEGSGALRIFSYAAVIDDLSQDPILVIGQDDPGQLRIPLPAP